MKLLINKLQETKNKSILDESIKFLEKKFNPKPKKNMDEGKKEVTKKLEKESDANLMDDSILRLCTEEEKVEKQKKLDAILRGDHEKCDYIKIPTKVSLKKKDKEELLKKIKVCRKRKFQCKDNQEDEECAHKFKKKVVASTSKLFNKINPFKIIQTISEFDKEDCDENILTEPQLNEANVDMFEQISKLGKVHLSEDEQKVFDNISLQTFQEYIHPSEIQTFFHYFYYSFLENRSQVNDLPELPDGWITQERKITPIPEILSNVFHLIQKGDYYQEDPYIRIMLRLVVFRHRDNLALYKWQLGKFKKSIYVHKRALKSNTHPNKVCLLYTSPSPRDS